mgnify:CR=1 FL=1
MTKAAENCAIYFSQTNWSPIGLGPIGGRLLKLCMKPMGHHSTTDQSVTDWSWTNRSPIGPAMCATNRSPIGLTPIGDRLVLPRYNTNRSPIGSTPFADPMCRSSALFKGCLVALFMPIDRAQSKRSRTSSNNPFVCLQRATMNQ